MPPPVKMPIRAVRAALVWFRKTTALDGKAGIGAGAAIDPVAPIPAIHAFAIPSAPPMPRRPKQGFDSPVHPMRWHFHLVREELRLPNCMQASCRPCENPT